MDKRTLTIEEMIAAGASWAEISAAVKMLQKEHNEKKRAEEAAKAERARKAEAARVARDRMVQAFTDWGIAEGFVPEEDREELAAEMAETVENVTTDMRHAFILRKILG